MQKKSKKFPLKFDKILGCYSTIEELLLGNYRQQTIVSAGGLCQRITLGQLPFVHVLTGNRESWEKYCIV
jgi:hypothetical protein